MSGFCAFCSKVNMLLINAIDTVSTLAGGTQPYTATTAFTLRGLPVAVGDVVQLSTAQGAWHISAGLVAAPAAQATDAPDAPVKAAKAPKAKALRA
jgi:hypothetical protein